MANLKAIIADDEEQLRIYLKSKLAELWPELIICGEAENGLEALNLIEYVPTRHRLSGYQDAGIVRNRSGTKN